MAALADSTFRIRLLPARHPVALRALAQIDGLISLFAFKYRPAMSASSLGSCAGQWVHSGVFLSFILLLKSADAVAESEPEL